MNDKKMMVVYNDRLNVYSKHDRMKYDTMLLLLLLLLLYAFRDLWKEWGESNFQIFPQNCQFHHRRLESLGHFNVLFISL